jgi:hypothetical protein
MLNPLMMLSTVALAAHDCQGWVLLRLTHALEQPSMQAVMNIDLDNRQVDLSAARR